MRVVSGGQTGVDRGALQAALGLGVPCGGWCPAGRAAEDGPIPAVFPLTELLAGSYADRTRRNVLDSSGTVLIYAGSLSGGSRLTRQLAEAHGKPLLLLNVSKMAPAVAAARVVEFARAQHIETLNVAGPRASEWPAGEGWAQDIIRDALLGLL